MTWTRRRFLRTATTTVALPFLESLLPRNSAAATPPPQRFLVVYAPNGMMMDSWTPQQTGAGYDLPSILQPLQPIQSKVSVITGLQNLAAQQGGAGDHSRGMGALLTCTPVPDGSAVQAGVSVDQVIASQIGNNHRFASLQLLLDSPYECDFNHSCVYNHCISWRDAHTPLLPQSQAAVLFAQMFEGADPGLSAAAKAQRLATKKSVLDVVLDQVRSMQGHMSSSDNIKLDQYLTGVRDLEQRLSLPNTCPQPAAPSASTDFNVVAAQMTDLITLVLQCDLTRVVTFMLGQAQSERVYTNLGYSGPHHGYSHEESDPTARAGLLAIDAWEVGVFASLLQKLDAVNDAAGGSLLDNSAVLMTSELSDGNAHSHVNLPVLLGGGLGGVLPAGQHIVTSGAPDIGSLYLTLLAGMGIPMAAFGQYATSPLMLS